MKPFRFILFVSLPISFNRKRRGKKKEKRSVKFKTNDRVSEAIALPSAPEDSV